MRLVPKCNVIFVSSDIFDLHSGSSWDFVLPWYRLHCRIQKEFITLHQLGHIVELSAFGGLWFKSMLR